MRSERNGAVLERSRRISTRRSFTRPQSVDGHTTRPIRFPSRDGSSSQDARRRSPEKQPRGARQTGWNRPAERRRFAACPRRPSPDAGQIATGHRPGTFCKAQMADVTMPLEDLPSPYLNPPTTAVPLSTHRHYDHIFPETQEVNAPFASAAGPFRQIPLPRIGVSRIPIFLTVSGLRPTFAVRGRS